MNRKTPAGRPESAQPEDPFDFDGDADSSGPGAAAGVRLNKFLAQNGIASRRGADELIAKGRVQVDRVTVTELGRRIDPATARVEVDGVVLAAGGERPCYYLLNKPKGVVCTNDPREARLRAIDLVTDKRKGRIYTVGRLDEDTEGLVILTNDGEFANRISHPRYGLKKLYWVDVRGRVSDETLAQMREGVRLSEGWGKFEEVLVKKRSGERSVLLVTLAEGKNREVRRVFAALDLPVRNLRRVSIGPLQDKRLKIGEWRKLTRSEVGALLGATRGEGAGSLAPVPRKRRFPGKSSDTRRRPWSSPSETRRADKRGSGEPRRADNRGGRESLRPDKRGSGEPRRSNSAGERTPWRADKGGARPPRRGGDGRERGRYVPQRGGRAGQREKR